jgi:hypothetical protein
MRQLRADGANLTLYRTKTAVFGLFVVLPLSQNLAPLAVKSSLDDDAFNGSYTYLSFFSKKYVTYREDVRVY